MNNSSSARGLGYDAETGEVAGQLMLGINVPSIRIQRKAELGMSLDEFNAQDWHIRDGDRLTVTGKDGLLIVKLARAWEQER